MATQAAVHELITTVGRRAEILRKQVDIVHSSGPMTLKERHCANVLLLNAMKHGFESLQTERYHTISVADLCEDIFDDRRNRTKIKKTLDGLLQKKVEWQYTTEKLKRTMGASTWLAGYHIEDGILRYSYSAEIVDKILSPKIWARLNHSIQHLINRSHSQSLYEQCARYRDYGATPIWSLDIFRGLMGVRDCKSYSQFKSLNRSVIKPAVKEVNDKTEIFIEPVFYKERGLVAKLKFQIKQNTGYDGPNIPGVVPLSTNFDSEMLEERSEVYERLLTFGLDHSKAVAILEDHDDDYIAENLKVVADRIRAGQHKIRNVPGYVINALEQDYRPQMQAGDMQAALDLETEEQRSRREAAERAAEAAAALSDFESKDLIYWRAVRWETALPQDEWDDARESFKAAMFSANAFVRKMITDNPESRWIAGLWRQWIRDHKLGPVTEEERQACAKEIGFDLDGQRTLAAQAQSE